ncbi:aminopeptidase N [Lapillicoccus sp.]|uniref:aminopeptidase N n=1 Tax=Lapillicoccus sp. TaxID=1909287 RepID=UPI0025FB3EAF|nr:aminopeptidase N [Lapillicoccus sp.]
MPGTNLTREEAATRADLVSIASYDIELDLTTGATTFSTTSRIRFSANTTGAETFVDFVGDSVQSISLNGEALDPATQWSDSRIALPGLAADNELVVVATGSYTNTGEGLHRVVDPVDDEVYLYSQFEVPDSRRVYAVFEQPDLKATFAFTVHAPSHWQLVSNSPTPEPVPVSGPDEGEQGGIPASTWVFAPTPRLSSYVTALVAGPYDVVRDEVQSRSGTVPLAIYARKSLMGHVDAQNIFDCTKVGFAFFEKEFDSAYPFAKYDQIFTPEYNAGAMENAGCVTITEVYVFRSKVSESTVERRALTILHELAHMWFGDLVTMRWWDDLWLNESFAEWASTVAQAEATTEWPDAWTTFQSHEKTWAYEQDQLPSTHPVYADIRDLDDVLVNFDGITYAKGGSVLKQLVAYVGREAFTAGLRSYFAKYAWGNTRFADLLAEFESGSGRDLGGWSEKWLKTSGVNTLRLEVETDDAGVITAAAIVQTAIEAHPTMRPHRLAIGRYDLVDGALTRVGRHEVDVDGPLTAVPDLVGLPQPDLLLPNDDDLTYAKLRFDERSQATALAHAAAFTDSLPRSLVIGALWEMVRSGDLASRDLVPVLLDCAAVEQHSTVLRTILMTTKQIPSQLLTSANRFTAPEHRAAALRKVADALRDLADDAAPGSDRQFQLVTAYASLAHGETDVVRLRAALDGTQPYAGLDIDQDMRWTLLGALASAGAVETDEIDAELERDATSLGRERAYYAKAVRPTAEAKAEAWRLAVEEDGLPNSVIAALGSGFNRALEADSLLGDYIARFHDSILTVWESRSAAIRERILHGFYPLGLSGPQLEAATSEWMDAHPDAPAAVRRIMSEHLDVVRTAVRAQAADAKRG